MWFLTATTRAAADLVLATQTAVVFLVGVVNSTIVSAVIGGIFLTANSFLTVWLMHRMDRRENEGTPQDRKGNSHHPSGNGHLRRRRVDSKPGKRNGEDQ